MVAKKKLASVNSLQFYASTSCLENFSHETIAVEAWGNQDVICKAMSAGDWIDYQNLAKELIKKLADEVKADVAEDDHISLINPLELHAFVFCRCVYEAETKQRILQDDEREAVVQSFSPVHDKLVAKVYELSRMAAGDDPKND